MMTSMKNTKIRNRIHELSQAQGWNEGTLLTLLEDKKCAKKYVRHLQEIAREENAVDRGLIQLRLKGYERTSQANLDR